MDVPALTVFSCEVDREERAPTPRPSASFPSPGERAATPCPVRMPRAQRGDTLGGGGRWLRMFPEEGWGGGATRYGTGGDAA